MRNWMIEAATILFDDSHNDLRALPKTVRLQILTVLSFVWSTVFSLYFFQMSTFVWGWTGMIAVHLGLIFACYYTFKQFHNVKQKKDFKFGSYHSLGRSRGAMIGYDRKGNPYKVELPNGDPGGEHE